MLVVLALAVLVSSFFLIGAIITSPGLLLTLILGFLLIGVMREIRRREEERLFREIESRKIRAEKFFGLSVQNRAIHLHKDDQETDIYIPGLNLRYYKG